MADEIVVSLPPGKTILKFRCLSCEKTKSKKGSPMLAQEFEVCENTNDTLNGLKIKFWSVLHDNTLANVNRQRSALGLPLLTSTADYASVNATDYPGLTGYASASESTEEQKNEVTGEVLVNPNTGKPMTFSRREINDWCAR